MSFKSKILPEKPPFLGDWASKPQIHGVCGGKFGLLRRASEKSETSFVNQLSILFYK
jgi:hypothetical protein